MKMLKITHRDGKARRGELATAHGCAQTPAFMPVGTAGTVKGLTPDQLERTGSEIILSNTYHLMLRPGPEIVHALGGVHGLMGWDGPMLTDSGGFQVFSLSDLRLIDDESVVFKSHIDGSKIVLSPERATEVQHLLAADIMMQLDECTPADASHDEVAQAVRRSADWAARCKSSWNSADQLSGQGKWQALFAIQQGGVFSDLRAQSAQRIVDLDLPGYAIGGLSVGEGHDAMCEVLEKADEQFPSDKPRYLMGVGEPRDIIAAVASGVDMFDCVMPTRNGRNAQAFTSRGRLKLRNAKFAGDNEPVAADCSCYCCQNFSRGAIHHFFKAKEMIGPMLLSLHNLHFFADLLANIRSAIEAGEFEKRSKQWLAEMYG